jgi:hypothetical protein
MRKNVKKHIFRSKKISSKCKCILFSFIGIHQLKLMRIHPDPKPCLKGEPCSTVYRYKRLDAVHKFLGIDNISLSSSSNQAFWSSRSTVLPSDRDCPKGLILVQVKPAADEKGRKHFDYFIHFQGWNSSWDR